MFQICSPTSCLWIDNVMVLLLRIFFISGATKDNSYDALPHYKCQAWQSCASTLVLSSHPALLPYASVISPVLPFIPFCDFMGGTEGNLIRAGVSQS